MSRSIPAAASPPVRPRNRARAVRTELAAALEELGIGNEAELTVLRAGRERTVSVRVIDIS